MERLIPFLKPEVMPLIGLKRKVVKPLILSLKLGEMPLIGLKRKVVKQ